MSFIAENEPLTLYDFNETDGLLNTSTLSAENVIQIGSVKSQKSRALLFRLVHLFDEIQYVYMCVCVGLRAIARISRYLIHFLS